MKKSSFFTFIFALIPGAGQMYLGLMKKGVTIMALFAGIISVMGFLSLEPLALLLPVIWFYAFFDTFNMRYLTPEQLREEDKLFFGATNPLPENLKGLLQKRHKLVGGICIVLGIYIIWENFSDFFYSFFEDYYYVYEMLRSFPTMILAMVIIFVGIYLIRGKKNSPKMLEQKYDFKEFGGEKDD